MSGPYAAGFGKRKRDRSVSDDFFFFSSDKSTQSSIPLKRKTSRVTHADAEIIPKFRPEDGTANMTSWLHKITNLVMVTGGDSAQRQFVMQFRPQDSARRWYDELDD